MKNLFKKRILKKRNKSKDMYRVNVVLVLIIFALLFIHLSGTNNAVTEGFILKKLSYQLAELRDFNKNLTLKSAEMQSIARIKELATNQLGMVSSGNKDYIILSQNKNIVRR